MSRRPTMIAGKPMGMPRTASTASIAMPPPTKIPARPPSVQSTLTSSVDAPGGSRQTSPRKSVRKVNGNVNGAGSGSNGKGKETVEGGEINIQVVVRCRGRSPIELSQSSPIITSTSGALSKQITIETTPLTSSSSLSSFTTASSYSGSHQPMTKTYPFDKVLGPEADQTMVFKEVAEGMLDEVLAGYNCTIFAYGQTGTGKTYTMQGDLELSPLSAPKDSAGIVPRVLHRLFTLLETGSYLEYSVKCSYVELYNEELRDLLSADYNPSAAGQTQPMSLGQGGASGGLKLYEDGKKGVLIQGLEEVGVKGLKDALGVLNRGCQKRQVAETKMNTESSRSHTIFSITVHIKETGITGSEDLLKVGKFNLVDLAGSEAIGRSGATDKRAREAGMINQSLLTLGRVISALVDKASYIPYRDSKLTRLLQDSLGGRTKTCIVAAVSPTRSNMEETLSTLDYAIRAKSIRNRPEVNQHMTRTGLLKEYLGDIDRLKNELMASREKNGIYIPEDQWREMHEERVKQKSEFEEAVFRSNACMVELASKKKEFEELSVRLLSTTADLEVVREKERELRELMVLVEEELRVKRRELEEERVVSEAYMEGEERLDEVAGGLKKVAMESVGDVGGLFEKLARKAKVLGANADASTRFGGDLQGLSSELRQGLHQLDTVQGGFGRELKSELESFARQGQDISKNDLTTLEASFSAITDLASQLSKQHKKGQHEAVETSAALLKVKEEVQSSVREWAKGVSEKSTKMVGELLEHQQEHLSMVGSVLDSTADLVDAVIKTARDHLLVEAEAAEKSRRLASESANAEITRLRAQNTLLAQLLASEKTKTAKLRTDLLQNLTTMIVDFTDAQDSSLSAAVQGVQAANEVGVREMGEFARVVESHHAESSGQAKVWGEELDLGEQTAGRQRLAGKGALDEFTEHLRTRLEGYGRETVAEASRGVEVVDGACGRMQGLSEGVSHRASSRLRKQSELVTQLSTSTSQTLQTVSSQYATQQTALSEFMTSLLSKQGSSSSSYAEIHGSTSSSLNAMMDRTERYLTKEIVEDVPTGVTPRKRTWEVTQTWDRTQPRELLIAAMMSSNTNQNQRVNTSRTIITPDEEGAVMEDVESVGEVQVGEEVMATTAAMGLSASQMRAPRAKIGGTGVGVGVGVGMGMGKMGGEKGRDAERERERERNRIALAPLGEGGGNIPRRTGRK